MLPRVKAVNCLDSSAIGTCQNPEVKSKASSINLRCSLTSSTCGGRILLNCSLNGVASGSLSSITCSAAFVRPISFFSKENKSWYSVRRLLACLAALASQDSNPDKSNFLKSVHCLSSSDIHPTLGVLTGLELKSTGGIMLAVTILAMGTPFWTSTHSLVLFLSTTVILLIPVVRVA